MNIEEAARLIKKRPADAHKGVFGKALLCVGSYGMMGAAVLSTRACLRSGVGLCYVCSPERCMDIVQISVPEAVTPDLSVGVLAPETIRQICICLQLQGLAGQVAQRNGNNTAST